MFGPLSCSFSPLSWAMPGWGPWSAHFGWIWASAGPKSAWFPGRSGAATIIGAILGGYVTSRWGIAPSLFGLGALQALSNLGYWVAAWPGMWRYTTYIASLGESLTGGMGSAPFMAFMMLLCDKRHSATHYAFFSMLFGFTRTIAGYLGGLGAARFG